MQRGQEKDHFEKFSILYIKIFIFGCGNLQKINFFLHFLGFTQNHAQSCRRVRKGKILEKFQIYIVKSSFFDVKTYEKLTLLSIPGIDIRSWSIKQRTPASSQSNHTL